MGFVGSFFRRNQPTPGPLKPDDWTAERLAGGRYEVIEEIGAGGFGRVYKARDHNVETDVVVKVPHGEILATPGFRQRFQREIRALARLQHQSIVKIIDVGEHGGMPYFVMQFLNGQSLDHRHPRNGTDGRREPQPPESLTAWLEPIAGALDFVHQEGYVHRDVKPENILFDRSGHAYLGDFGIAKVLDEAARDPATRNLTKTGMLQGTPWYMAPERIHHEAYDGRADQYALAVIVFELLSGRFPVGDEAAKPLAAAFAQVTDAPQVLGQVQPGVPAALSDAVARALSKDPRERFPDCLSFARAALAGIAARSHSAAASSAEARSTDRVQGSAAVETPAKATGAGSVPAPMGAVPMAVGEPGRTLRPDSERIVAGLDLSTSIARREHFRGEPSAEEARLTELPTPPASQQPTDPRMPAPVAPDLNELPGTGIDESRPEVRAKESPSLRARWRRPAGWALASLAVVAACFGVAALYRAEPLEGAKDQIKDEYARRLGAVEALQQAAEKVEADIERRAKESEAEVEKWKEKLGAANRAGAKDDVQNAQQRLVEVQGAHETAARILDLWRRRPDFGVTNTSWRVTGTGYLNEAQELAKDRKFPKAFEALASAEVVFNVPLQWLANAREALDTLQATRGQVEQQRAAWKDEYPPALNDRVNNLLKGVPDKLLQADGKEAVTDVRRASEGVRELDNLRVLMTDVKAARASAEVCRSDQELLEEYGRLEAGAKRADHLVGKGDFEEARSIYQTVKPQYQDLLTRFNDRIGILLRQADAKRESGEFTAALETYSTVLAMDARQAMAHAGRGDCFLKQDDFDQAISAYEKAHLHDATFDVKAKLAVAHYGRASAFASKGDYEKAIADYKVALAIESTATARQGLAAALAARGDKNLETQNYDRALADYEQAASTDPDLDLKSKRAGLHLAYRKRADNHVAKKNYDQAIADYTSALRLDPDAVQAYCDRGNCYYRKGRYDEAIADGTEAIRRDPAFSSAYNMRGNAYDGKKEYVQAIADYTEAIRRDARHAAYFRNRANTYGRRGDPSAAIADYTKAIELSPSATLYLDRGSSYSDNADYDHAIADFSEAIRLEPSSNLFNVRGNAYYGKKDFAKAVPDYTEAIRLSPQDVVIIMNRAGAYRELEEHDRAIADYGEAIRLEPTNKNAYDWRAYLYRLKKDFDKAITDASKAIDIDPKMVDAYNNRGWAFRGKNQLDKAIADFTKAIELNPKAALSYRNRAEMYFSQAAYDKAISDCTEAIRLEPNSAKAFNVRGNAYYGKKEFAKAVPDYTEAIRLSPQNVAFTTNRASAYRELKEYDKAIADYGEAIRLEPTDKNAYHWRAYSYRLKKDFEKAITDASKAIDIDPKMAAAYNNRGWAFRGKNQLDKAVADFTKAIELDPSLALSYTNRADTYRLLDRYDEAIADCTEAIRIDPANSTAFDIRGIVYDRKKEYAKAIVEYTEAIRLSPTDVVLITNRANTYCLFERYDEAIADCTEALRLDPANSTAFNLRGNVYYKKEEYAKAIVEYTEAIRVSPKDVSYVTNRGAAYDQLKEYDKAIADFSEAIRLDPKYVRAYQFRATAYEKSQTQSPTNAAAAARDRATIKELEKK